MWHELLPHKERVQASLNRDKRILSIDDDPDVTLTLKTILENDGHTVDVFNDPIIALESFKKAASDVAKVAGGGGRGNAHTYDLILTDFRMPKMNGFELYQKIREIDKNIKVRFLTASEINYGEFGEKVAPTMDGIENCFIK